MRVGAGSCVAPRQLKRAGSIGAVSVYSARTGGMPVAPVRAGAGVFLGFSGDGGLCWEGSARRGEGVSLSADDWLLLRIVHRHESLFCAAVGPSVPWRRIGRDAFARPGRVVAGGCRGG